MEVHSEEFVKAVDSDDEIEELFSKMTASTSSNSTLSSFDDAGRKFVERTEREHQGILTDVQLLQKEDITSISKQKHELEKQLNKYKNIKGFSNAVQKANLARSHKRDELRKKIYVLDAKIEDLKMEIEGAKHWKEGTSVVNKDQIKKDGSATATTTPNFTL